MSQIPIRNLVSGRTWKHLDLPDMSSVGNARLKHQDWHRVGEERHSSKLTEAKVREIVDRFNNEAISVSELAREFGISNRAINGIFKGETWTHLDLDLPKDTSQNGERHWRKRRECPLPYEIVCVRCGAKAMKAKASSKYCSLDCETKTQRARAVAKHQAEMAARPPGVCPNCEGPVDRTTYGATKYCSPACRVAHRYKKDRSS